MPSSERKRIRSLIETETWAKAEYDSIKKLAGRDGYSAAFLYAVYGDKTHFPVAREYLLRYAGRGGDLGPKRRKQLGDASFFKAGQPWLGDVYYGLNIKHMVAYDWACNGLTDKERKTIEGCILASAMFRMRAMDRWRWHAKFFGSLTGDNWQIGFIRPGELDAWRGKKKESAKTSGR